jgi:hypothetical protein
VRRDKRGCVAGRDRDRYLKYLWPVPVSMLGSKEVPTKKLTKCNPGSSQGVVWCKTSLMGNVGDPWVFSTQSSVHSLSRPSSRASHWQDTKASSGGQGRRKSVARYPLIGREGGIRIRQRQAEGEKPGSALDSRCFPSLPTYLPTAIPSLSEVCSAGNKTANDEKGQGVKGFGVGLNWACLNHASSEVSLPAS